MNKFIFILLSILLSLQLQAQKDISVLVFSKTNGFRHSAIDIGKETIGALGESNNWQIHYSEDSLDINSETLAHTDVVIFLNTTGDILGDAEEAAMENYIQNGGGFVGIHSASDTEYSWPWYHQLVGAHFKNHPKTQEARLTVHQCNTHPATAHMPEAFQITDEWYNFTAPVEKHVNVLLSLDENSYQGGEMNGDHPIAWYHHYDGGRAFYTGLGHTKAIYENEMYQKHLEQAILWAAGKRDVALDRKWKNLLDKELSQWDVYMGVPHVSVEGLPGVPKSENVHEGQALGLNNDPKNVFSTIEENGEVQLKITGEIYGGLTSKAAYKNYHLKAEFKWGTKKWEPRLDQKRDNGILYHCRGSHGSFWNVWMSSLECQVQETDCGDFIGLAGASGEVRFTEVTTENGGKKKQFDPNGIKQRATYVHKNILNEKPNGEWNTIEVICVGTTSIHVVNGQVVNVIENATYKKPNGEIIPLDQGQIQIQSEAAETYYRNIQIRGVTDFPRKYKKQM